MNKEQRGFFINFYKKFKNSFFSVFLWQLKHLTIGIIDRKDFNSCAFDFLKKFGTRKLVQIPRLLIIKKDNFIIRIFTNLRAKSEQEILDTKSNPGKTYKSNLILIKYGGCSTLVVRTVVGVGNQGSPNGLPSFLAGKDKKSKIREKRVRFSPSTLKKRS